jgi:hypothetical protein
MPLPSQDNVSIYTRARQYQAAGAGLARFFARTNMVLGRKDVGYRLLSPAALGGTALILYSLEAIGNVHLSVPFAGRIGAAHTSDALSNLALLVLGVGAWQRRARWNDLLKGRKWHTFSYGVSRLEFLPIRRDLIYRFVDPAVGILTGLCLRKLGFSGLGLWIAFSGFCLHVAEQYRYGRQMEHDLDTLDSQVESEVTADTAAHFEGEDNARSLGETGGIPTGADAGLEAIIARRKKSAEARP